MDSESTNSQKPILLFLIWGFLIPQFFLAIVNLRAWSLIRGETNDQEQSLAVALWGIELTILLTVAAVTWAYRQGKIKPGWKMALLSLCIHTLFMWSCLVFAKDIIPDSIQRWILSEGNVGRWNITLMMPAAFLSLYALTKQSFTRISSSIVFIGMIGIPVLWYLFVSLMQPLWMGQIGTVMVIIIATILVTLFLGSVIRFFDNMVHKQFVSNFPARHYVLAVLLGLAAPLGGLYLNEQIPFPVDFQSTEVYLFTFINGLILLIKPDGSRMASGRLFIRCALFPFIFYFFIVFLPFLPLSLLAILALGAGFLMLTPLALGLFQTSITLSDFRLVSRLKGRNRAIVISVAGLLLLPGYFVTQAVMDKNSINQTLNYFYSHNLDGQLPTQSSIDRSARVLLQLRDRKADIQLPYISGFYNAVVFGDLVLSDKKISRMYELLTNSQLPEESKSFISSGRRNTGRSFRGRTVAPKQDIEIANIEHSQKDVGESTLSLTLQNNIADTHSLFVGQLSLQEGVFVTGMRLKIEDEWVPARIFDRKTALWVFQKITEVRRDPAILYYRSPTTLELRVYPFPAEGIREVEIDFAFHPDIASHVIINDQKINLNSAQEPHSIVNTAGNVLVNASMDELAFERQPYIHFILDYAIGTNIKTAEYISKITRVSEELGISKIRITAANITSSAIPDTELLNIDDVSGIEKSINKINLPRTGGLWVQQAIAGNIIQTSKIVSEESLASVPVFVVVSDNDHSNSEEVVLDAWSWLIPDMHYWYSYTDKALKRHSIQQSSFIAGSESAKIPVIAIKKQSSILILPALKSSIVDINEGSDVQVYSHLTGQFAALPQPQQANTQAKSLNNSSWPSYAGIWQQWRQANLNPSQLEADKKSMHKASRELNVMLPVTSYIVVESASQWEILKRKEKQSLANHSALDFEEEQATSEPPWWLLLAGLLIFLYFRERKPGFGRFKV